MVLWGAVFFAPAPAPRTPAEAENWNNIGKLGTWILSVSPRVWNHERKKGGGRRKRDGGGGFLTRLIWDSGFFVLGVQVFLWWRFFLWVGKNGTLYGQGFL